ncbi:hypothetical protein KIH32_06625 [Pseudomonas fluorescens]|uniref:hypothetical protein n=1 Tax=Pseudomonas fluorescens TaxID=294 RepID=UPI001BD9D005|nr:hypothetical protein [Pseudomonas fluorescens]MBT0623572.1 hypothetical protein [Pseudomonas fluorescens]
MKACVRCEREMGLESFYKNSRSADGLAYACKACMKESRSKEVSKRCYQRRREALRRYHHERYAAGGESSKSASRLSAKEKTENLSDGYIRRLITQRSPLLPKNIPLSLVAAKRLQIQIVRLAKELTDEKC